MRKQYRVDIHIRVRGQAPMEFQEFKSEEYTDYDEYSQAIKDFVIDNINEDLDGGDEDETNIDTGL